MLNIKTHTTSPVEHCCIKMFSICFIILLIALICNVQIIAQDNQSTEPEFPVGATLTGYPSQGVLNSFNNSRMNTVVWKANASTRDFLSNYNVIAFNQSDASDWINHYATGYYSKWESENSQSNLLTIGVKHKYGSNANWRGDSCWSTIGTQIAADSLIYGPHYFQGKTYRRWLYQPTVPEYVARFRMAFDNLSGTNENVCIIKVVDRFIEMDEDFNPIGSRRDTVFLIDTLRVSDFPSDGSFKYFSFSSQYQYPSHFWGSMSKHSGMENINGGNIYVDSFEDTGIQFCVDWLGNSSLGTLYIDFTEVYDNDGWNWYVNPETHQDVLDNLQDYTQNYSNWDNIKYWYAHDEPYTIDAFIPIRIVDSLVRSANSVPLITEFWEVNTIKNGEPIYEQFYEAVQPQKLMFDAYPFHNHFSEDIEVLRAKFQLSHTLQPGFFFVGQGFGGLDYTTGYGWLKPDSSELKSNIMLALAHGAKGILFWNFDSYDAGWGYVDAIVEEDGTPTELWYVIHDNFAPRLKGKLGKTLLGLSYTGDFLQMKYFIPTETPIPPSPGSDYLTIGLQATNHDMNWHVGFFNRTNHSDDKYFLMANLLTNSQKQIRVRVTPPVQGYTNYRFRNVEPENNFDVTFTTQSENTLTFPAGEGYLFEVAPVVKYGGKLITNETVGNGMTLYDAMTIENGATLTISGNYNCLADITIKSGRITTTNGGSLNFSNGKKLIVEGRAYIYGTSSNKLNFNFTAPTDENGVVVAQNGELTMTYCSISNAVNGIKSSSISGRTIIQNVDFSNCSNSAINILE